MREPIKRYSVYIIIAWLVSPGMALADAETQESRKCSRYFDAYENQYVLPSKLLKAVALQESGRWNKHTKERAPWPWAANISGKAYYFKNKREAVATIKRAVKRGYRQIDIGCMQINWKYHKAEFNHSVEKMFEPQYNVRYSAKLLRKHYDSKKSWRTAISAYHSGMSAYKSRRGKHYTRKILTRWHKEVNKVIQQNKQKTKTASRQPIPKPKAKPDAPLRMVQNHTQQYAYD